jgi:hypothetical protein
MKMKHGYLVYMDNQDREHEAILRLLENPLYHHYFFSSLGLHPTNSWYLLEVREHRFNGAVQSEIDIIGGRLEPVSDKINWLRSTEYLVAVEAKLAYFDEKENKVKSQKSSPQKIRQIQSKIEELSESGFDRVVLLDMIANPPASGENFSAFTNALEGALNSVEKMTVLGTRLSNSTPAGHWVWPIGSVVGGDERMRGAGAPFELKKAGDGHPAGMIAGVKQQRRAIRQELRQLLSGMPSDGLRPLVFIDCRSCGKIHNVHDDCKPSVRSSHKR